MGGNTAAGLGQISQTFKNLQIDRGNCGGCLQLWDANRLPVFYKSAKTLTIGWRVLLCTMIDIFMASAMVLYTDLRDNHLYDSVLCTCD